MTRVNQKVWMLDLPVLTVGSSYGLGLKRSIRGYVHSRSPISTSPMHHHQRGQIRKVLTLCSFFSFTMDVDLQLQNLPEPLMEHQELLRLLLRVITSSLDIEIGYTHPLWIPRACAMRQYLLIMVVVRGYKKLAAYFVERGMAGFRIKPKLHALHHLAYDLRLALKPTHQEF